MSRCWRSAMSCDFLPAVNALAPEFSLAIGAQLSSTRPAAQIRARAPQSQQYFKSTHRAGRLAAGAARTQDVGPTSLRRKCAQHRCCATEGSLRAARGEEGTRPWLVKPKPAKSR